MSESRCRVSERKNIHGDASTCVLIATLAIKELPILLSKLRDLADSIGRAYAPLGIKTSSFFQRMRESHKTQLRFPVALHFTVTVSGIPSCDKHRDKLALKVGSDKKLLLQWTSLQMMRRYLAANRNRPAY